MTNRDAPEGEGGDANRRLIFALVTRHAADERQDESTLSDTGWWVAEKGGGSEGSWGREGRRQRLGCKPTWPHEEDSAALDGPLLFIAVAAGVDVVVFPCFTHER